MKIQELSETKRKVILWAVVGGLGIALFFWWGRNVQESFKNTSFPQIPKEFQESIQQTKEEFTFPSFQEIKIPEEVLQGL